MSGSLSGVGGGIQPPISKTFEPGRNTEVRQEDEQRRQSNDVTQNQGTNGVKETREVSTRDSVAAPSNETEVSSSESRRGSIVNITV